MYVLPEPVVDFGTQCAPTIPKALRSFAQRFGRIIGLHGENLALSFGMSSEIAPQKSLPCLESVVCGVDISGQMQHERGRR